MVTLYLYKLKPNGWRMTSSPDYSQNVSEDAELVFIATASSKAEALDEIDKYCGNYPTYLAIQNKFREAIGNGLKPSEAVCLVHKELGEFNLGFWADHFHDALGVERMPISYLFIDYWPNASNSPMSDEEFDRRVNHILNSP